MTSVRVVGPLYGLQSRTYGYDMAPNKKLTVAQFQHFFTPWWYAPKRMVWDHKYVSIQPVPTPKPTAVSAVAAPRPAVSADPAAALGPATRSGWPWRSGSPRGSATSRQRVRRSAERGRPIPQVAPVRG